MRRLRVNGAVKSLEYTVIKKNKKGATKLSLEQDQSQKSERESQSAAGEKNENFRSIHKRSEFNLAVSTIILSSTFSAIYNLPGGVSVSDSNGKKIVKATLGEDEEFQVFIILNTCAFGIAFFSIFFHFLSSVFAARELKAAFINLAFYANYVSVATMFLAYFSGLSPLLPN